MTGPAASPSAETDPVRVASRRVAALLDAPPPLLVVTDFDGTLSRIDPDPLGARIEPLGRAALRRLARLAALHPEHLRVVILSGRAALDVAVRVRVSGVEYLGNHGIERGTLAVGRRPELLAVTSDHSLAGFAETAQRLGTSVAGRLGSPDWLFVEHKGPAIAFHFRGAPDETAARARVDRTVAEALAEIGLDDLHALEGRKVIEVRPAAAGGKGAAMERLLTRTQPGAVLALGDDVSDAEAFRVLVDARRERGLESVTVGVRGGIETPPEILAAADLVLAGPHDAARLLSALAREFDRRMADR